MITVFFNWHKRVNGSDVSCTTDSPELRTLLAAHGVPDTIVVLDARTEQTAQFKRTYPITPGEMIMRIGRL